MPRCSAILDIAPGPGPKPRGVRRGAWGMGSPLRDRGGEGSIARCGPPSCCVACDCPRVLGGGILTMGTQEKGLEEVGKGYIVVGSHRNTRPRPSLLYKSSNCNIPNNDPTYFTKPELHRTEQSPSMLNKSGKTYEPPLE